MADIETIRKEVMNKCFENCHNGVCMRDQCLPKDKQQYFCPNMEQEDNAYLADETIIEKAKLMGILEGKKEETPKKAGRPKKEETANAKPVEVVEIKDNSQPEVYVRQESTDSILGEFLK